MISNGPALPHRPLNYCLNAEGLMRYLMRTTFPYDNLY